MRHFLAAAAAVFFVPALAHADFMPTCTRLAFSFVIDRSGSMTGQPIESAKAAASAAVDKLGTNDCVGVIAFDSAPTTIVPMQPLTNPGTVKAAIARIQAGGGTEILTALDAAHKTILGQTAARKRHIVLLTDGQSPVAGLQSLAQTMNGEHVTLTTIGYGSSVDEQTLKMLSTTASGRYYHVMDPNALTTVFGRDVDATLN
jgi:secreted protein with Ig-like and vWFA domain